MDVELRLGDYIGVANQQRSLSANVEARPQTHPLHA